MLAAIWLFLPALGGFALFYFVGPISEWLRSHETLGPVIYSVGFAIAAGLGLLPTYSQAFLGGWAFGPVVGTLAALAGFAGGSTIGYVVARRAGKERVEREIERHPKWRIVRDALLKSGPLKTLGIVTLVRIPPNSPFSLTNLVLSTTGVPLWSYLIGTAVGMLPRTAIVVWVGSQFEGQLSRSAVKDAAPPWLFWGGIGVAVVVFVLLVEVGKRALARATRSVSPASADA